MTVVSNRSPWTGMLLRIFLLMLLLFVLRPVSADTLTQGFSKPPASASMWVYWFWVNGNVTKQGITADLEAMKRVGVGGAIIFDVDWGAPKGPAPFAGPEWRALFRHACLEARRLGLQLDMSNAAGWCGSGGPWITPDISMQKVVWTETTATGPAHVDLALTQPEAYGGYYRDISVLAFPTPSDDSYRIDNIKAKAGYVRQDFPAPPAAIETLPEARVIPTAKIVDLTAQYHDGKLSWDVPPGRWTVMRFGHTSNGMTNHPAPLSGLGLESDKLSKAATDAHFAGLMSQLIAENPGMAGRTLVKTHVDSWETGTQNWTPLMRQEFMRLRGYDLLPYLPVLSGRVVGSLDVSERFLWDFRQALSDLLVENYAHRLNELAHQHGITLDLQAYGDCLTDDFAYAGAVDEPQGEVWSWWPYGAFNTSISMASAAHVYGKRILSAESFTAGGDEKWQGDPAILKPIADWEFCLGINKLAVHRYTMQPWNIKPGLSMGITGMHYERTNTWWNQLGDWHRYIARCQALLQQGLYVADIVSLMPEGAPRQYTVYERLSRDTPAYKIDACNADVVLTRMSVRNGQIVLPDGVHYRLLTLPDAQTMTPRLLTKIIQLVEDGATVIGTPPVRSPSLIDYPQCDTQVKALAARLWGDQSDKTVFEHRLGKGRVVWNRTPEQVLASMNVPMDFSSGGLTPFRYIHRHLPDGADFYFVVNKQHSAREQVCTFRVAGRRPELWWPQTGRTQVLANYQVKNGVTQIPLHLEPLESAFVVFRQHAAPQDALVSVTREGSAPGAVISPSISITRAVYGVLDDPSKTRDVRADLQKFVDSGVITLQVIEMVVQGDPAPALAKALKVDYTIDGQPCSLTRTDWDIMDFTDVPLFSRDRTVTVTQTPQGKLLLEAWKSGHYRLAAASGKSVVCTVPALASQETLPGPWLVKFPPVGGKPADVHLDTPVSWSALPNPTLKYFSGTATYRTAFQVSPALLGSQHGLYLDLGDVQVMARVKVNGKDLGVLWEAPYRVDISQIAKPGRNTLELQVTNQWINRMIGDEHLPEDSDRNPDGTLKAWPQWLLDGKPNPTGRVTFTTWRLWQKDSPLQPSGLIGPVTLIPTQKVLLAGPK